jgi:hypothetical protein
MIPLPLWVSLYLAAMVLGLGAAAGCATSWIMVTARRRGRRRFGLSASLGAVAFVAGILLSRQTVWLGDHALALAIGLTVMAVGIQHLRQL